MAYVPFVDSKPVASDNGNDVIDDVRENLLAMRDAAAIGTLVGWSWEQSNGTGDEDQPQYEIFKRGTEWIRITLVWGTTGGEDGNIVSETYEYSSNSGGSYAAMGSSANPTHNKLTKTYSTAGNQTSESWGAP